MNSFPAVLGAEPGDWLLVRLDARGARLDVARKENRPELVAGRVVEDVVGGRGLAGIGKIRRWDRDQVDGELHGQVGAQRERSWTDGAGDNRGKRAAVAENARQPGETWLTRARGSGDMPGFHALFSLAVLRRSRGFHASQRSA